MTQNNRPKTINSRGEVIDRPVGVSRWSSPRTYACAHQDCPNPATVLKAAAAHTTPTDPGQPVNPVNAHNCCGHH